MAGFSMSPGRAQAQGPQQGQRFMPPGASRSSVYLNGQFVDPESEQAAPRYKTDPGTGIVDQYNPYSMTWSTMGQMGGGGASASRGSGNAAAAGTGGYDMSAINGLLSQLNTPATYEAAQTPITTSARGDKPYEMAAEDAAFGAAKSRMANSTKAALTAMRENLASRGIYGSAGAEALGESEIRAAGLSELGAANNALAQGRSQRAFTADQSDTDRTIGQQQYNVGAINRSREFNAQDQQTRRASIASLALALKGGRY